jgi:hypothetical protein
MEMPQNEPVSDDDLPTTSSDAIDPTQSSSLSLCDPFFTADGTPTGVELAVFKDDGTLLDPEVDCVDFQAGLQAQSQELNSEQNEEAEEIQ